MKCSNCGVGITDATCFEIGARRLCAGCFTDMAIQQRKLTSEERERLKRAVKEEMAGVLPRDALRAIFEETVGAVLKGEDYDEVENRAVNRVEQIAGLAMLREMLSGLGQLKRALVDAIEAQEGEIRDKIRKLTALTEK
jgi:hypothetical protein